MTGKMIIEEVRAVLHEDLVSIERDIKSEKDWKKRGGTAVFFLLAQKWDQLETCLGSDSDIFQMGHEGRETITTIRRTLALVEAEYIRLQHERPEGWPTHA